MVTVGGQLAVFLSPCALACFPHIITGMSQEPRYLIEPGHSVGRDAYVSYLYRCSAEWERLGEREQSERVANKAAQIQRREDDVSLACERAS